MGTLTFYYGTMNCGKSTLALQMHHNARAAGKSVLLFSKLDRAGAVISSRIGLSAPATTVGDDLHLHDLVVGIMESGQPVDEVIVDEAQFLGAWQVDHLARLADERDLEVRCFGLLSDFQTRLFPGSQRLLELADRREELQLDARCWCGARGTHNARILDGRICVLPIPPPCRLDDFSPFLWYAAETFGEVANRKVDHPDRRQAHVHAARRTDSRRRGSVFA